MGPPKRFDDEILEDGAPLLEADAKRPELELELPGLVELPNNPELELELAGLVEEPNKPPELELELAGLVELPNNPVFELELPRLLELGKRGAWLVEHDDSLLACAA